MDRFFGLHIQADSMWGMSVALLLSVLLGGLVGLERELHAHPAGLRTHILVCLGSCLMTLVSVHIGPGSDDRIAAQVVSGVGFLGAGAIIREGASVRGLTTAASIWSTAGMGIALGASPFFSQIAVVAAFIVIFTLWVLNKLEVWLEDHGKRELLLSVTASGDPEMTTQIVERLGKCGVRVQSVEVDKGTEPGTRLIAIRIVLNNNLRREAVFGEVLKTPGVTNAQLT
jgi:putative Mg2+ transporter-C (MgtC) family protein